MYGRKKRELHVESKHVEGRDDVDVVTNRESAHVHAEWITLHDNPDFRGFVDFLRAELDRVGPAQADLCRDFFRRAVALELSFFEAAYAERT
jgi:thiaminase